MAQYNPTCKVTKHVQACIYHIDYNLLDSSHFTLAQQSDIYSANWETPYFYREPRKVWLYDLLPWQQNQRLFQIPLAQLKYISETPERQLKNLEKNSNMLKKN